jgi:hypothetical protein
MWATIFYGALSRPPLLSHQAAQVGLGEGLYPNPQVILAAMFGHSSPPAGGAVLYRLTKYVPATAAPMASPPAVMASPPTALRPPAPVPGGVKLEPLPLAAPDLKKWQVFPDLTVTQSGLGYRVGGSSPVGGYQLLSPLTAVPPNHQLLLRVRSTVEQGDVCVGVLNESQERWLLPPYGRQDEVTIDSGNNRGVWFVFVTCGHASGLKQSIRFEIESISYAVLMNAADQARP